MIPCPHFIGGQWIPAGAARTPVYNPSTGEVIAECPAGGAAEVGAAVDAAAAAFPAWSETPAVERARVFFRYRQLVEQNFDRLCQSVTREHGKTLAEARGSIFRGLENIEYACGIPSLLFGDTLENLARGVDCETLLQPLGVCAGITPFNFPAMVPLWMFPNRARLREHLRPEAEREGAADRRPARRAARAGRPAQGRPQPRPRRPRERGRAAHPPEGPGRFLRRLLPGRQIHLRDRHPQRQARPGERRGQELHRHHARCRRAEDGRGALDRRLRLRRRALHGRIDRAHGRRGGRTAPARPGRGRAADQGRPDRPAGPARHGARHHRASTATGWPAWSRAARRRAPKSSATAAAVRRCRRPRAGSISERRSSTGSRRR